MKKFLSKLWPFKKKDATTTNKVEVPSEAPVKEEVKSICKCNCGKDGCLCDENCKCVDCNCDCSKECSCKQKTNNKTTSAKKKTTKKKGK